MFLTFVSSNEASHAGTTIIAANKTGPSMVITMNDFFFTLDRYSLDMINFILFMTCNFKRS